MASSLLPVADIGGSTRFMKQNRQVLSHAQQLVAELLGGLLDEAEGELAVSRLEGDVVRCQGDRSRPPRRSGFFRRRGEHLLFVPRSFRRSTTGG